MEKTIVHVSFFTAIPGKEGTEDHSFTVGVNDVSKIELNSPNGLSLSSGYVGNKEEYYILSLTTGKFVNETILLPYDISKSGHKACGQLTASYNNGDRIVVSSINGQLIITQWIRASE